LRFFFVAVALRHKTASATMGHRLTINGLAGKTYAGLETN
jgi:hypothetical protein